MTVEQLTKRAVENFRALPKTNKTIPVLAPDSIESFALHFPDLVAEGITFDLAEASARDAVAQLKAEGRKVELLPVGTKFREWVYRHDKPAMDLLLRDAAKARRLYGTAWTESFNALSVELTQKPAGAFAVLNVMPTYSAELIASV